MINNGGGRIGIFFPSSFISIWKTENILPHLWEYPRGKLHIICIFHNNFEWSCKKLLSNFGWFLLLHPNRPIFTSYSKLDTISYPLSSAKFALSLKFILFSVTKWVYSLFSIVEILVRITNSLELVATLLLNLIREDKIISGSITPGW